MKSFFALLLALMLLLCPCAGLAEEEKPAVLGDFQTTDIYGQEYSHEMFQNAPLTFVNVWGTYCNPCIDEMPYLAELAEEYQGKVQFVGIVGDVNAGCGIDEQLQQLAVEIAEQTGAVNYPHLIATDEMNARVLFSINAIPTSFFVDAQGRQVGYAQVGSLPKENWKQLIEDTLALLGDSEQTPSGESADS